MSNALRCEALPLYLDGELDVPGGLEFEAHAETCETCRRDLAAFGALRQRLRTGLARYKADDRLRGAIMKAIGTPAALASAPARTIRPSRSAPMARWLSMAAAALIIAVVSSGVTRYLSVPGDEAQWLEGIVAAHERAMISGHEIDVASSSRHVVKPWFSGKTAIAPLVVDLDDLGFTLLGGRLDVPVRAPMPALVYRAGPHVISVYMQPAAGEAGPHLSKRDGFSILGWTAQGFAFYAVSDADGAEVGKFQKAFAARAAGLP